MSNLSQGAITVEQMVQREAVCCLSSLVHTLAQGFGAFDGRSGNASDIMDMCEQAFELAAPVDDWEEAARQAGWKTQDFGTISRPANETDNLEGPGEFLAKMVFAESWQEACEHDNLEPYEWEVCEHWAVSTWLSEQLLAQGEKVDTDFAGMNVWARTCTGQGIASDGVMRRIHAALTGGEG